MHTRRNRGIYIYDYDAEPVIPTSTTLRANADGTNEAFNISRNAECTGGSGPRSRAYESQVGLPFKMLKCISGLVARAKAWLLHIHCSIYDEIDSAEDEIVDLTEYVEYGIELSPIIDLRREFDIDVWDVIGKTCGDFDCYLPDIENDKIYILDQEQMFRLCMLDNEVCDELGKPSVITTYRGSHLQYEAVCKIEKLSTFINNDIL